MIEQAIQEKVTAWAAVSGLFPIRINVRGRKGWPDYGYIYKGRILLVEYKKPGEKATPLQLYVHGQLAQAGATVLVVDDVDLGVKEIRKWMDKIGSNSQGSL